MDLEAHPDPTSLSLLQRVNNREPQAWERLVYLYGPLVARWCRHWSLPPHDLEDVLQDVFLAVAQQLEGFRRDRPNDKFRKWLWTITRNKVCDYFRKQEQAVPQGGSRALQQLQQIEEAADDSAIEPEGMLNEVVKRALRLIESEFSAKVWQMFWRATVDGQAPRQIAVDLDVTANAVRVAKFRVLKRLRLELCDDFETGQP